MNGEFWAQAKASMPNSPRTYWNNRH